MRERVQKVQGRRKLLPLLAWSLTGVMSLAIVSNALFGQPDHAASLHASVEPEVTGAAPAETNVSQTGARTIQLKYDPVVESVQRELSAAGYYKGLVDGVIGRKTKQAITAYQQASGLEPDGKPSAELADHIRFTREVSEASLFTGTIEAAPDAESRASIRRVQTGLSELAYNPGVINGELTTQTRDAILAYQRDRSLPQTGEVSDQLLAELSKMSGQSELANQ